MFEEMAIHFCLTLIRGFIKSPMHAKQFKGVLLDIRQAIDDLYSENTDGTEETTQNG